MEKMTSHPWEIPYEEILKSKQETLSLSLMESEYQKFIPCLHDMPKTLFFVFSVRKNGAVYTVDILSRNESPNFYYLVGTQHAKIIVQDMINGK